MLQLNWHILDYKARYRPDSLEFQLICDKIRFKFSVALSKNLTILVQLAGTWNDVFGEPKCFDSAATLDCANKSVYLTAESAIFLECFLNF